ncbi:MAG: Fe-S cluster assembly sulfur transfer protein SufU [Candidatus Eutrophobiaceae bacterium]
MTEDLSNLYQELIIDHNRHPRNFGALDGANRQLEGFNPLCGDKLTLYLKISDHQIADAHFSGEGCAISIASASIMTDMVKSTSVAEAQKIFVRFHDLIHSTEPPDFLAHGKLAALAGVRSFPSRVKCATLGWHTLNSLLHNEITPVSTE